VKLGCWNSGEGATERKTLRTAALEAQAKWLGTTRDLPKQPIFVIVDVILLMSLFVVRNELNLLIAISTRLSCTILCQTAWFTVVLPWFSYGFVVAATVVVNLIKINL